MRVSRKEMDKSHQRIVEGAAKMMRQQGIETTSVSDVMSKAGLTHGGFYRHFESKEALVSEALGMAFDETVDLIDKAFDAHGAKQGGANFAAYYLSEGHLNHPELGCPVAALGADVTRASNPIKAAFDQGFNRVIEKLAQAEEGTQEEQRAAAMRKLSMLAGCLMIARATGVETSQAVLAACLQATE